MCVGGGGMECTYFVLGDEMEGCFVVEQSI